MIDKRIKQVYVISSTKLEPILVSYDQETHVLNDRGLDFYLPPNHIYFKRIDALKATIEAHKAMRKRSKEYCNELKKEIKEMESQK